MYQTGMLSLYGNCPKMQQKLYTKEERQNIFHIKFDDQDEGSGSNSKKSASLSLPNAEKIKVTIGDSNENLN